MKAFLLLPMLYLAGPVLAEDWTTSDGKLYQDVKVVKVEDDAVTILYKDGGARVALAKLPAPLQKKFSYDPVKAKAAADLRAKADAENAKNLQAEMNQAQQLKLDKQAKDAEAQAQAKAAVNQ
jgi:hypothetical protein